MDLRKLLKIAINASIDGGRAIMEVYSSEFKVEYKSDDSPLTLADKRCNEIIENYLLKTEIPILSEEGAEISFKERESTNKFKYV